MQTSIFLCDYKTYRVCAAGMWATVHCLACVQQSCSEAWVSWDTEDRECAAALWAAVQRLTREQLAFGLLQVLADLEEQASQARILILKTVI